jgi:hypothetical protein
MLIFSLLMKAVPLALGCCFMAIKGTLTPPPAAQERGPTAKMANITTDNINVFLVSIIILLFQNLDLKMGRKPSQEWIEIHLLSFNFWSFKF